LPYACLLSTKGAYYGANKQVQIKASLALLGQTSKAKGLAKKVGCAVVFLSMLASLNKQA
jgi:hypothetical protein